MTLDAIVSAMREKGLSAEFLARLEQHAKASRPILRMAEIWASESDGADRDETVRYLSKMFAVLEAAAASPPAGPTPGS